MSFAEATAVTPAGPGRYRSEIAEGWDIQDVTNGGYLTAIISRAMSLEADGRRLMSVTGHFLNPARPGPADISAERLKTGREFTTVRAVMTSGDRPLLAATGSLAQNRRPESHLAMVGGSPPDIPPPDDCERAISTGQRPFPPPFADQVEVRIHPDDTGGALGNPSGQALVRGWFRLLDDEPVDELAVVVASDAMPPAIFNIDRPAWTPTLDLTVHVRDPGPHDWLACSFRTRFVTAGLLEEDGEIWDSRGGLVALSRQLALVGG